MKISIKKISLTRCIRVSSLYHLLLYVFPALYVPPEASVSDTSSTTTSAMPTWTQDTSQPVTPVQSQDMMCRASSDCNGASGDVLGVMPIEECCLNTPDGLGFSEGDTCLSCIGRCITIWHIFMENKVVMTDFYIVFGFFQDSFIGVEQGQAHTVQAGYLKGAAFARTNLIFNVVDIPGTASELTASCLE